MLRQEVSLLGAVLFVFAGLFGFSGEPQQGEQSKIEHRIKKGSYLVVLKDPALASKMQTISAKRGLGKMAIRAMVDREMVAQQQLRDDLTDDMLRGGLIQARGRQFGYLLNGFEVKASPEKLLAIRDLPQVAGVYPNLMAELHTETSVPMIGAPQAWQKKDPMGNNLRGTGMTIAIIDTGIDYNHPDLGGGFGPGFKVAAGYDFFNDDADPMDDHGHGTHVAGIAAGNGVITGVAPEAALWAYKVFNDQGNNASTDVILAAIEHAVNPDGDPLTDDGADVINMSLGYQEEPNGPVAQISNQAVAMGTIVVVSAGNSGVGVMGAPASAESVITVASCDVNNNLAGSSNRGPGLPFIPKPDITAPGVNITSCLLGGGTTNLSGTSMASPHVAGAAALLLQLHPDWDPQRIKLELMRSVKSLNSARHALEVGAGRLDLSGSLGEELVSLSPVVNLGRNDVRQNTYTAEAFMTFHNEGQSNQTVELLKPILPGGLTLTLDRENLTVAPGATEQVRVTLNADNTVSSLPSNFMLSYSNAVIVNTPDSSFKVHLVSQKAYYVAVDHKEPGLWNYLLITTNGTFHSRSVYYNINGTLEYPLRDSTYVLMGYGPASEGRYVFAQENIDPQITERLTLDPAHAIYSFPINMVERDGRILPLEDLDKATTTHRITHLDSGRTWSALLHNGGSYRYSQIGPEFRVELTGAAARPEAGNEFFSFDYQSLGVDADQEINLDLNQAQRFTWRFDGMGDERDRFMVRYLSSTSESNLNNLVLDDLLDIPRVADPFELVVYETGRAFPVEDETEAAFRIMDVIDPDSFRILAKSPAVGFDDQGMAATYEVGFDANLDQDVAQNNLALSNGPFLTGVTVVRTGRLTIDGGFEDLGWLRNPMNTRLYEFGSLSLEGPDGFLMEANAPAEVVPVEDADITPGAWRLFIGYNNLLNGEPAPSSFELNFNISDTDPLVVPRILGFSLQQNGLGVQRITAAAEMQLQLENATEVTVELDQGQGWEPLAVTLNGDTANATIPQLPAGTIADLRIAVNGGGHSLINTISKGLVTGYRELVPWVVNNENFTSRFSVFNGGESADIVLRARDREGELREETLNLAAGATRVFNAGELFGDLTGYSLEVAAPHRNVHTAFLTLNLVSGEGLPAPSQTAGIDLESAGPRLIYPYLPEDQIGAVVLFAPNKRPGEETLVYLARDDQSGNRVETSLTLSGAQPLALLSDTLFEQEPQGDVAITAWTGDGTVLSGTTFAFNHKLDPSMAMAGSRPRAVDAIQFLPWVVANETWYSRLALYNKGETEANVTLTAVNREGDSQQVTHTLNAGGVLALDAAEQFPGLGSAAVTVSSDGDVAASALTFLADEEAPSPSQTAATTNRELGERLMFAHLPSDQVPAVVLTAPYATGAVSLTLNLYSEAGLVDTTGVELTGNAPLAQTLGGLFTVNETSAYALEVVAPSGILLTGLTFIFNADGEPSMARPVALPH